MFHTGHGLFSWNELITDNVDEAKAFYAQTLGWTYEQMELENGSDYWVAIAADDEPVAGLTSLASSHVPLQGSSAWFAYIEVDDVDARAEAAGSAGGRILRAPFEVPGVGRIAVLEDPTGAPVGILTSELDDEDGAAFEEGTTTG